MPFLPSSAKVDKVDEGDHVEDRGSCMLTKLTIPKPTEWL
jgi:hypothetical protein